MRAIVALVLLIVLKPWCLPAPVHFQQLMTPDSQALVVGLCPESSDQWRWCCGCWADTEQNCLAPLVDGCCSADMMVDMTEEESLLGLGPKRIACGGHGIFSFVRPLDP
ncbi:hypothetical protein GDO81_022992 [Engystomops pustulosus]|uniref:Uncharacterized protein n=1 Tax=Engystomops pustulosus TaxID=76066 RepID=A0AAV6ZNF3_ENGPU|nr:hypothetical protein GDO81_022992 [Engystomops pustulosus]